MSSGTAQRPTAAVSYYPDNHAYLADELDRLESLLRLRVAALRRDWRGRSETASPMMYVGHDEVDWLLGGGLDAPAPSADEARLHEAIRAARSTIDERVAGSARNGVFLGLPRLAALFGLSAFETDAVLICLAPELRRRYDRVYAYLQDDITRKRPSVDLVLELLCESEAERWTARALLTEGAPLLQAGILQTVDDPHSPSGSSGLAQFLRLDPRILEYLLGHGTLDARLARVAELDAAATPLDELPLDPAVGARLLAFAHREFAGESSPRQASVLHLHGPRGVGKRALAAAVAASLDAPLLRLDARRLTGLDGESAASLRLAARESLLLRIPLYVDRADAFLAEDDRAAGLRHALEDAVAAFGWLVILGGERPWPHHDAFAGTLFHSEALPLPDVPVRAAAWTRALAASLPDAPADAAASLAERFRLTPGQIHDAVSAVAQRRAIEDGGAVTFERLAAAARAQTQDRLDALASRIRPRYGWDDLVLPDDDLAQLREMCGQVRDQFRVYQEWGFGRKLAHGRGLSALFSGPPGTGKTMAAEVVAAELRLDLYKIDLARVVSKYIGETEKNLARVFDEAEDSNAILFFDEADALFGKRTEVSDAHDRYANIEISYLLQRMEEYEGVVILASNLRENMDDAFLRRIRFIVEFPFPDAASRLRIWRTHFPPEAPVSEAVDAEALAERVQVAGGSIRNIVLNAAFFAAADGGVIGTEHILQGVRREFGKIGKLWDERVFARPRSST